MPEVDSVTLDSEGDQPEEQPQEMEKIVEDLLDLAIGESGAAHTAMMLEITANGESAHSVVRHGGAQKFLREDPIEAAATEMILNKK